MFFCSYNESLWLPKLFSYQLSSKYLIFCSTEERHTGLEWHEGVMTWANNGRKYIFCQKIRTIVYCSLGSRNFNPQKGHSVKSTGIICSLKHHIQFVWCTFTLKSCIAPCTQRLHQILQRKPQTSWHFNAFSY